MPGFASEFIKRMASISGREKNTDDWEQLLQLLSELLVTGQLVGFEWSGRPAFTCEPTAITGGKNPEIEVSTGSWRLGVEVKAPSLLRHIRERASYATQLNSRALPRETVEKLPNSEEGVTLPRDNPSKDFLASANDKFDGFKKDNDEYIGLLVIVWDDFVNEPISALIHPESGLLTTKSFARDNTGAPLTFSNVDGVVVVRHLHQFMHGCREEHFEDDCRHSLDYGREGEFPFKVYLANPHGCNDVPEEVLTCLQAHPPSPMMGSEYVPSEVTFWF